LDLLQEASFPREPSSRTVHRLAADGARIATVLEKQIAAIPADATHIVMSVGGNDGLVYRSMLGSQAVTTVGEALLHLGRVQAEFDAAYTAAVKSLTARGLPVLLVVPHNPQFADETEASGARTGLALLTDAIYRAAALHSCSVMDLRLMLTDKGDWANPLELSSQGGFKLAAKVVEFAVRRFGEGGSSVSAAV